MDAADGDSSEGVQRSRSRMMRSVRVAVDTTCHPSLRFGVLRFGV
jgi:hypothetical protein